MTVVDAHQHFWDRSIEAFDHSWQEDDGLEEICRDFMPPDLKPLIAKSGVDATIFVQTQHNLAENRWALKLAEENDFVCGVVGWIDLTSDRCEEQLLEFREHPKFVGIRHVVQDEPEDDFIIREDVLRGLAVLEKHSVPYDLLFYPRQLKHASTVARKFPGLPLVIDHLAKPRIKTGEIDQWSKDLKAAADCENVYCKLSGLVTEADWQNWTLADMRPYAETAIECFGAIRLMFGSDWPVCELAATYQQVVSVANELLGGLSVDEQAMVMGMTAQTVYGLTPDVPTP